MACNIDKLINDTGVTKSTVSKLVNILKSDANQAEKIQALNDAITFNLATRDKHLNNLFNNKIPPKFARRYFSVRST